MKELEDALSLLLGTDVVLTGEDTGGTEALAGAIREKAALLKEFRESLELPEDGDEKLLMVTLKNLIEKAGRAQGVQEELESLRQELEAAQLKETDRQLNDLLDQGVREGKITPSTREWWAKLSLEQLEKHLPDAPVIVPQGITALSPAEKQCQDLLTDEDKAVCRRFGIPEDAFLTEKKKYSCN